MPLVLKCDTPNLAEGNEFLRPSPVWAYEDCAPVAGDEVFVWTTNGSSDGGGLSMRGSLLEWSQEQLTRSRPGVALTIRIENTRPRYILTIADLARYDTRRYSPSTGTGPQVKLCRKLWINSHKKIAQLDPDEADFLRSFFDQPAGEAMDASVEIERMVAWAARAVRPGQQEFSEKVRCLYRNRCAVTGCATGSALQAAHIRVQDGVDDNSAANGILLRADIHLLFDALLVTLAEDGSRLELSRRLTDPAYDYLREAALFVPVGPSRPSRSNILHHRDRFRQAEAAI
ncbi:HNH endonuclease signature motif containing protein [Bradyrhizobium sp. BEA-2-5]|uniref:HNH endonuclease n=1 Tax=Bradyrhizobium sp. BEA-2-5 TaxID=3080015 RepID=UPI00293E41D3|nr:HNH endonuclease signature motif containing protein [Bradyrhizobium sp. BEA-2-5]WOH82128.1 HNH endonuclease signature motif containing protein [Bradyrhizobium sp. BEA-2-5]